jgi:hypothetical protein
MKLKRKTETKTREREGEKLNVHKMLKIICNFTI